MAEELAEICRLVKDFGSAPTLAEMPRRTLADKGIAGPTAAHVIEEIHTPHNLAYTTYTTGSSALPNIVGVTREELERRAQAAAAVFQRLGLQAGSRVLVTYPPLVNVFSGEAFRASGISCSFLIRSSRDAFLAALYETRPHAVVGESSFLRAALEDARHMRVADALPQGAILLAAGTPLDLELLPAAEEILHASVHDLYGCQEFGWLALDGVPLREDIELLQVSAKGEPLLAELVVGGLPAGDRFPVSESGHVCGGEGKIITYRRQRSHPELEVIVHETPLAAAVTIERAARSILRIKGRIVKVSPGIVTTAAHTVLELKPALQAEGNEQSFFIEGPQKTRLFDDLAQAQLHYQQSAKADPTWQKRS